MTLAEVVVMPVPFRFGILGLGDVGRVSYQGRSANGWMSDVGAGIWLAPLGSDRLFSTGVARSPLGMRLFFQARFDDE